MSRVCECPGVLGSCHIQPVSEQMTQVKIFSVRFIFSCSEDAGVNTSSQALSGFSFVVFFETWTSLYLDTSCLLCVLERREGSELSMSCFYVFFPQLFSSVPSVCVYVCVGRCVGVFMAPFLVSTPPPSIPSLFSISIFSP